MGMTIRELADELGVSKQTIQKIIEKLPDNKKPFKKGNKYILEISNQLNIKRELGFSLDEMDILMNNSDIELDIPEEKTDNLDIDMDNSNYYDVIDILKKEIKNKNEQINSLMNSNDGLQKLLEQQQILTLNSNKKNIELENEIKNNKKSWIKRIFS